MNKTNDEQDDNISCYKNDFVSRGSVSLTLGSQPPADENDEEFVNDNVSAIEDEGGCTALALVAIGVFSSVDDAKQALNNEIPLQKQQWHKQHSETKRAIPSAGINNEEWHNQTIQQAVINNGFHFQLVHIGRVQ